MIQAVPPSTFVVFADNTMATLNRIVSVLRAKRFRILSLTMGPTPTEGVACLRMTIEPSSGSLARVAACLEKIEEVRRVSQESSPTDSASLPPFGL